MGFFSSTPAKVTQVQKYTPQQQNALNQLLSRGLSGVQSQQPLNFEPIAQQARMNFQQNTVPGLAERFESMGSNRSSSGLLSSLSGAGANLESQLAALGSQFGLQSRGMENQQLQSLLGLGTQSQFDSIYHPEQQSTLQSILPHLLRILPMLLGGAFGGPAGAALGGAAGSGLAALGGLGQQQ